MIRLALGAMGTRFELVIPTGVGTPEARSLRAAGEEALELIREWHDRFNAFDRGSLLSRINRCAHDAPVRVDPELRTVLAEAEAVRTASGGAFDVGVGGLMRAHGFRPGEPGAGTSPGAVVLDLDQGAVSLEGGAELDLGAIAKGGAIDAAVELLRDAGVGSALLHGGASTIAAIGAPPDAPAWAVRLGAGPGAPRVLLRDRSVSYSAPRPGGVEHVMDPRTGRPVAGALAAACVGESTLRTDAWSTALLVLSRRPAAMPGNLTSLVRTASGWNIEGPDLSRIELERQEVSP